jgi:outer membrane receptor protein involved in Fe transport
VEASGEVQLSRVLKVLGSYSYLRPAGHGTKKALLVGDHIKNIPDHTWRYGLRLDPTSALSVSLWGRAYSATRTEDQVLMSEPTIPAVALFDGAITYTWRRFTFQLVGTNLTDRPYERGGTAIRPLARERLEVRGAMWMRF